MAWVTIPVHNVWGDGYLGGRLLFLERTAEEWRRALERYEADNALRGQLEIRHIVPLGDSGVIILAWDRSR